MCLNNRVIGRCTAERSFGTESRDSHVDELGVDRLERIATQIQCVHGSRAKVMNDHIHLWNHVTNDRLTRLALKVNLDGFFTPITSREQRGDIAFARADVSHGVARIAGLYFDDSRALLGEHHACQRRRNHRRELEDGDAFQWFHNSAPLMG